MREFKFRAWQKDHYVFSDRPIGLFEAPNIQYFWYLVESEGLEVEQYIGLKDKNGREIYEGDIVRDWKHISIVRYIGAEFFPFDSYSLNENTYDSAKSSTVVGNIREHPEILNT